MANNFVFKTQTVTSMKLAGILDTDAMSIDIDGEEKTLATLLSPFSGADVDIMIKVKSEEELDPPADQED